MDGSAQSPADEIGELAQALTGVGVLKVADTAAQLRTITGGSTLWIAALQGIGAAGDGGGGVYYWSTAATPDDGWSALNSGSGNSAGWRRINRNAVVEGVLTSALSARAGVRANEVVITYGFASAGDRGGGTFRFVLGVSSGANGTTKINTSNGQWQLLLNDGISVNIRQLGCKDDGVTACAAIINGYWNAWKVQYGIGSSLVLRVPVIQGGSPGYRLEAALDPPDQVNVTIIGEGLPYIGTFSFADTSTSGTLRSGSIFVCDANVNGIKAANPTALYPFCKLEDIGFLGPGAPNTNACGVDSVWMNFLTTKNVWCFGFRTGIAMQGSVIQHSHYNPKCYGNDEGIRWGGNGELVDTEVIGYDLQFNRVAHVVDIASGCAVIGGIIQGNAAGIVVGRAAGGHGVTNCTFDHIYMEQNGDDNPGYRSSHPGGRHVLLHSGGSINNTEFRGVQMGGTDPTNMARAIAVPGGAVLTFNRMTTNGALSCAAGSFVVVNGPVHQAGFTSITVDSLARVQLGTDSGPPTVNGGILPLDYTHDWANTGPNAVFHVVGNSIIRAPINAPYGAVVHYTLLQQVGAPHTITWSGFRMSTFNMTGASAVTAQTTISFKLLGGGWHEFIPQPSFGWAT